MREEDIFHEALAHAPAARVAYLDRACAGDPALRASVEALLRANVGATEFLGVPPPGAINPAHPAHRHAIPESPGGVIGPYTLLKPLGEGGFGVVYLAEQEYPVRRKVALKVLKPGMDTRQVVARFEAERQALAVMDHPNIAKVFDGGATPAGRPYFVMELVRGVPITDFCDKHHLNPRRRLELFVAVCQAVQHAHQKGIIHRDLKPSNILVAGPDAAPVVKVIDFGVAKALGQELTDKTLFTGIAQMVGTPLYMSPEQAGMRTLDIDTRTDIYSLGVLLYELLTGMTPFGKERFEQATYEEIRRIIREEDPPRPSTRLSQMRNAECGMRNGKPRSAARGLIPHSAFRIPQFHELDWIVLKAMDKDRNRRYETANSFALDVRRYLNDEPVLACPPSVPYRLKKLVRRNAGLLVATAVLGAALLLAVSAVGWAVRDRSARSDAARREQEARQERIAERVRVNLNESSRLAGEQQWSEALAAALRGQDQLSHEEVDAGLAAAVRSAVRDLETVRELERIRADRSAWVEGRFDSRGSSDRYAGAFRDLGVDVDRQAPAEAAGQLKSRPVVLAALIPALDDWAFCRQQVADHGGADRIWRVLGAIDPDPWRGKVRHLLRSRDLKGLVALTDSPELARQPAATLVGLSRPLVNSDQADAARKVLSLAQQKHPGDFWVHFQMGMAFMRSKPASPTEAAGCYRAALALQPRNSAAWNNLGNTLLAQTKLDEANTCYRRAIEFEPSNARAQSNLGWCLFQQGQTDAAIAAVRKGLVLAPNDAWAHHHLGAIHARSGRRHEAIECYRKVVELDADNAAAWNDLGVEWLGLGRHDEALKAFTRVTEIEPDNAQAHHNVGHCLAELGRRDDAIVALKRSIEIDPKSPGAHRSLGAVFITQKRFADAVACFDRAIELDPRLAIAHHGRGNALLQQDQIDEAVACWRRAIELDPNDTYSHCNLGLVLAQRSKYDEAIDHFRKAIAADPKLALAHSHLGIVLSDRKKDYAGAAEAFRQAVALQPDQAEHRFNLGLTLRLKGDAKGAVAALREAIRLSPDYARAHTHLARTLTTCAEPELRNADEALKAAKKAVKLAEESEHAWLWLGGANYRAGDWKACIAAVEKSIALQKANRGGTAIHWFFLAMAHWQLGDKDEARRWYEKAVARVNKTTTVDDELRRIQAEAEELLDGKK